MFGNGNTAITKGGTATGVDVNPGIEWCPRQEERVLVCMEYAVLPAFCVSTGKRWYDRGWGARRGWTVWRNTPMLPRAGPLARVSNYPCIVAPKAYI